jgi:hypothetical protein
MTEPREQIRSGKQRTGMRDLVIVHKEAIPPMAEQHAEGRDSAQCVKMD